MDRRAYHDGAGEVRRREVGSSDDVLFQDGGRLHVFFDPVHHCRVVRRGFEETSTFDRLARKAESTGAGAAEMKSYASMPAYLSPQAVHPPSILPHCSGRCKLASRGDSPRLNGPASPGYAAPVRIAASISSGLECRTRFEYALPILWPTRTTLEAGAPNLSLRTILASSVRTATWIDVCAL